MASEQQAPAETQRDIEDLVFDEDPSKVEEKDLEIASIEASLTSSDWTTETIVSQIMKRNINLSPDFQRREAWDDPKKSRFIESLFMGLPVPQLVLAEKPNERGAYIVLDGKQRLFAISRFAASLDDSIGFEPLRLRGLQVKSELEGKTLADIHADASLSQLLPAYENQTIRSVVVRNWKSEDLLYRIFIRLNTGNLPLSNQELRQALHPGPFTDFVNRYNSEGIKRALGIDGLDFRMRDVEILIRFFAFHEFIGEYRGNLKKFLDDTCKKLNDHWGDNEARVIEIASRCEDSIQTTFEIFRENAFRLWESGRYNRPFSRAIFDIMAYYFSAEGIRVNALKKRREVQNAFENLCEKDADFARAMRRTTNSIESTSIRLEKWGKVLADTLQMDITIPSIASDKAKAC